MQHYLGMILIWIILCFHNDRLPWRSGCRASRRLGCCARWRRSAASCPSRWRCCGGTGLPASARPAGEWGIMGKHHKWSRRSSRKLQIMDYFSETKKNMRTFSSDDRRSAALTLFLHSFGTPVGSLATALRASYHWRREKENISVWESHSDSRLCRLFINT